MSREIRDVAASVRQRLVDLSRSRGEEHQLVLLRYANERVLARLGRSAMRDRFVLKGAALFTLWSAHPHRPTRDLDLLGRAEPDVDALIDVFRDVLTTPVEPDGLVFGVAQIQGRAIREANAYQGIRLLIPATLGKTRIRVQVDVGFGDAVQPRPRLVDYPALLDHAPPRIRAYPPEAVIAEKFEAATSLGMANSRMKDFHDVWTLAMTRAFDGAVIARSIEATFRRRGTALPTERPLALTETFGGDDAKQTQWRAFLGRTGLDEPATLAEAVALVADFVMPPAAAGAQGQPFGKRWESGGPWT